MSDSQEELLKLKGISDRLVELKVLRQQEWDIARKEQINSTAALTPCIREIRTDTLDPPTLEKWVVYEASSVDSIKLRKFDGVKWGDEIEIVGATAQIPCLFQSLAGTSGDIGIYYFDTSDSTIKVIRSTDFGVSFGAAVTVIDVTTINAGGGNMGVNPTSISVVEDNWGNVEVAFSLLDGGGQDSTFIIRDGGDEGATWPNVPVQILGRTPLVISRLEIFAIESNTKREFLIVLGRDNNLLTIRSDSDVLDVTANWGSDAGTWGDGTPRTIYSRTSNDINPTGFQAQDGRIYILFQTDQEGTEDIVMFFSVDPITNANNIVWLGGFEDNAVSANTSAKNFVKIFATTKDDQWPSAIVDNDGHMIAVCYSDISESTNYIWQITFNAGGFVRKEIFDEVKEHDQHFHNLEQIFPQTIDADGNVVADYTALVTVTTFAGANRMGAWAKVIDQLDLARFVLFDSNQILITGITANRYFNIQIGFGDGTLGGTRITGNTQLNTNEKVEGESPLTLKNIRIVPDGVSHLYVRASNSGLVASFETNDQLHSYPPVEVTHG